jgi:hypothetical protein
MRPVIFSILKNYMQRVCEAPFFTPVIVAISCGLGVKIYIRKKSLLYTLVT